MSTVDTFAGGDEAAGAEAYVLPASFSQQRLWVLDQMEGAGGAYGIPGVLRLRGGLDAEALAAAVDEVAWRHESLRTVFDVEGGEPVQVVLPPAAGILERIDLTHLPEDEREAELARRTDAAGHEAYDLAAGPLFRARLVKLADDDHALLVHVHHIVSDGWSMGVLYRELSELYAAFRAGLPSPLADLPIQYGDYAAWQREHLSGATLERQLAFWRGRLGGAPALLELPTDHPRPAVQKYRGAYEWVRFGADVVGALRDLARQENGTLFMVLLAAWQTLLSRYSGQTDVLVGTSIAGRTRPELEGLIGFFANTLVLRGDTADDPTFRDFLRRAREATLAAYGHQEVPFEKLVEELQPGRSLSHNPLFQAFLLLQNAPDGKLEMPGVEVDVQGWTGTTAKFDLSLLLTEGADEVFGGLEYRTDLWDAPTIARLAGHLRTLLEGIAANPDRRLSELPMLDAAETHAVVTACNPIPAEAPAEGCLHRWFEARAAEAPDRIAVTAEDGSLTYGELNARANRLARRLVALGVGPESRVALCLERGAEMMTAILAVLKAGGAYVPLDPAYPADRIAYTVEDCGAAALLTQSHLIDRVPADGIARILMDAEDTSGEAGGDLDVEVDARSLAYVIYTSGSTGRPKGAMVTHANVARLFTATDAWFKPGADDVWTMFHSYAFDFSVWEIWGALLYGGRVVVVPYLVSRDPARFRALLAREGVTMLSQTPSAFLQLIQADAAEPAPLERLRAVVFGGEALKLETLRPWLDRYGPRRPRLVNMYGITETTVHVTYHVVSGADFRRPTPGSPIGAPIPDLRLYVLDRTMRPVPVGVPGELFVGGSGLARGYLDRPGLTAERFVPDPLSGLPGERLYRSGDQVRRRPDGSIEYLGRIDFQVKIRGFRIETGEIEAALLAHPRIREAIVLARPEPGGSELRLVAYAVPEEGGSAPSVAELRDHLRTRLPDYMVPAAFAILPALPLTGNGKVDRRALPEPEAAGPAEADDQTEPRTPTEQAVAAIWAAVLGAERVGVHTDFFALGGHSLRATQVVSRVNEAFGIALPLRTLFEQPTVAEVSAEVDRLRAAGGVEHVPIARIAQPEPAVEEAPGDRIARRGSSESPLSFSQQRLWFLEQMQPGGVHYNMPSLVRLRGALDAGALDRAVREIARRHEVLRAVVADRGEGPVQVVRDPESSGIALVMEDVSVDGWRARAEAEAWRPFDLGAGPLMRALLLRIAPDDHVLVLTLHHAVTDGWSTGILFRELSALYEAFAAGRPSPLPEPEVQYADYAAWQRKHLAGERLDAQVAWWRERLAGVPVLDLPTDRPRPAVQGHRGAVHHFRLPGEVAAALREVARREGATPFMVALAAFQVLLGRWAGQDDVIVGTPVANRTRRETEGTIGLFVNTLALRADLSGAPSFREVLGRVREAAMGAYAHQEVPFERLVEELRVERDLSRSPLAQVMFSFFSAAQDAPSLPGIEVETLDAGGSISKLDLLLALSDEGDGLAGALEYDADLFDGGTAERIARHFGTVLRAVTADVDAPVHRIALLEGDERRRVLQEWNATDRPYPTGDLLHALCAEQAARTPDAVAVRFEAADATFAELDARANRIARALQSRGVGLESRVAVCLERGPDAVAAFLGVMKAGGAYLPLDPGYPAERLGYMLADSGAAALVSTSTLAATLPAHDGSVLLLDRDAGEIASHDPSSPDVDVTPEGAAYVIYTSGSTGRPKGVVNTHAGICNRLRWMQEHFGIGAGDRILQKTPFGFDVSVWELFWPLMAGATMVPARPEGHREPAYVAELIERERVTVAHFVPSMLQLFADEPAAARCTSLRHVVCSGEALPAKLADRLLEILPGTELHNLYGPTEAAVDVTAWRCRAGDESVPIGWPVANTRVYVLDDGGLPLPAGVPGELYLGGVQVARGYLGRPALTAERFVPDAFSPTPGARLYRTGDRARRRADGQVEYLGRLDGQVKIRGFRVETGEVEAALAAHPRVRDAAVVARSDASGDVRLTGYVACDGEAPASAELRAWLQGRLPEPMVPAAFVALPALPLSPNGKVDRRALPLPETPARGAVLLPPSGDTEREIAALWGELLGIGEVGAEDNFFDLGGHSLLVAKVHRRLRDRAPGLTVVDLFRHPTVRSLAVFLDNGAGDTAAADEGRGAGEQRRGMQARQKELLARRRAALDAGEAP
jgi:amino acid adenylation domain-containing protein